jgi:hypothetical protein
VFVAHDLLVALPERTAADRLSQLACCGRLADSAADAYQTGFDALIKVGPFGDVPGLSKLVRVRLLDLTQHEGAATLVIRWEATGAAGALFPVFDADISVTRVDDDVTKLALIGAYRPPLGWIGAGLDYALLHPVAMATIRALLRDVATALADPPVPVTEDAGPT